MVRPVDYEQLYAQAMTGASIKMNGIGLTKRKKPPL